MVLATDISALNQELDEIALLAAQAVTETERHEARRQKAEERVAGLEADPRADATEVREARTQLVTLSRRAVLFEAQQQVLEGKARTLARFRDRLEELDVLLSGADQGPVRSLPAVSSAPASTPVTMPLDGNTVGSSEADRGALLRAQEELRRDIARHMHDGPAQSLANIALQAEIVQRLASRGDARLSNELTSLRTMVQSALETTKEFIFDVRPMVLDDLGLVPTLRRLVVDRGRRAGVDVQFDSQGPLRRLEPDLETGLFRIIAEAASGYLLLRPGQLQVRLDWSDAELYTLVNAIWADTPGPAGGPGRADDLPDDVPPALRAMIEANRSATVRQQVVSHALPDELLEELLERARTLGVRLTVQQAGAALEVSAPIA